MKSEKFFSRSRSDGRGVFGAEAAFVGAPEEPEPLKRLPNCELPEKPGILEERDCDDDEPLSFEERNRLSRPPPLPPSLPDVAGLLLTPKRDMNEPPPDAPDGLLSGLLPRPKRPNSLPSPPLFCSEAAVCA